MFGKYCCLPQQVFTPNAAAQLVFVSSASVISQTNHLLLNYINTSYQNLKVKDTWKELAETLQLLDEVSSVFERRLTYFFQNNIISSLQRLLK